MQQYLPPAILASLRAVFEANLCVQVVEAFGIVSSGPLAFLSYRVDCTYGVPGFRVRGHVEGLSEERSEWQRASHG